MQFKNRSLFSLFIFVFIYSIQGLSAPVQARIETAREVGIFAVGIGSEVILESTDKKLAGPAVFLGRALQPDGSDSFQIYLRKADKKVYYINTSKVEAKKSGLQTILNPYEQAGGTCSGYAIYGFLHQTNFSGFQGTGALAKSVSSEKNRTTLLVDNINRYYLTPQHQFSIQGILNKYGKDFGFTCKSYKYETFAKARDRLLNHLNTGAPVVVSFDVGPEMYKSPFDLALYDQRETTIDARLWIPRKIGERNSGGHSIVAAASFEYEHKTYLVMIDSDWTEPRVWDLEAFLNEKTDLPAVEFTVCK